MLDNSIRQFGNRNNQMPAHTLAGRFLRHRWRSAPETVDLQSPCCFPGTGAPPAQAPAQPQLRSGARARPSLRLGGHCSTMWQSTGSVRLFKKIYGLGHYCKALKTACSPTRTRNHSNQSSVLNNSNMWTLLKNNSIWAMNFFSGLIKMTWME